MAFNILKDKKKLDKMDYGELRDLEISMNNEEDDRLSKLKESYQMASTQVPANLYGKGVIEKPVDDATSDASSYYDEGKDQISITNQHGISVEDYLKELTHESNHKLTAKDKIKNIVNSIVERQYPDYRKRGFGFPAKTDKEPWGYDPVKATTAYRQIPTEISAIGAENGLSYKEALQKNREFDLISDKVREKGDFNVVREKPSLFVQMLQNIYGAL